MSVDDRPDWAAWERMWGHAERLRIEADKAEGIEGVPYWERDWTWDALKKDVES